MTGRGARSKQITRKKAQERTVELKKQVGQLCLTVCFNQSPNPKIEYVSRLHISPASNQAPDRTEHFDVVKIAVIRNHVFALLSESFLNSELHNTNH